MGAKVNNSLERNTELLKLPTDLNSFHLDVEDVLNASTVCLRETKVKIEYYWCL